MTFISNELCPVMSLRRFDFLKKNIYENKNTFVHFFFFRSLHYFFKTYLMEKK